MARPKKIVTLSIGDKVKLATDKKSEGVIVHRFSNTKYGKEWSVHWYNQKNDRGVYNTNELKKYY